MAHVRSDQLLSSAVVRALAATDDHPWCFIPVESNEILWQSQSFQQLCDALRTNVEGSVDANQSMVSLLQQLSHKNESPPRIEINDRRWTIRTTVVLDQQGQPGGRLIRLEPASGLVAHEALLLASYAARRQLESLSPREVEVVDLVYEGLTNKAIAARSNISQKTVEKHRGRISRKLRTSSVAQLVRLIAVARYSIPDAHAADPSHRSESPGPQEIG